MNANEDYFESVHPKCDFWGLGCIGLERIIQKCSPNMDFCSTGCIPKKIKAL